MPRLTNVVADRATRLLTREVVVNSVTDLTPHFRRIDLTGEPLHGASWSPGQKVQVRTSGFTFRTYTPFAWGDEQVSLLTYRHGSGPASEWIVGLEVGERCQVFGPRRSLDLASLIDDPIVLGDETSFALTASWRLDAGRSTAAELYEVTSPDEARSVLDGLDLSGATLVERDGDAHLDHLVDLLRETISDHPAAPLVLTGKAQTIQRLRASLKAEGITPPAVRVKAYWDINRSGLD